MSIIVSNGYALSALAAAEAWKPIIGWQSVVTYENIAADSETAFFPATNLSNPDTNLLWVSGVTTEHFVTSLFGTSDPLDYVGIARHNLGSSQIPVTVEGLPPGGDSEVEEDWIELVGAQLLANDNPALFRFVPTELIGIRLRLAASVTAPQMAIFRAGALLVLPNGVPIGHVPITYARTVKSLTQRAQNGDFLGQVNLTAGLKSSIEQRDLDPDWYRANLDPLRLAGPGQTFFWAWSPENYPNEVGYCWPTNDPMPTINRSTGEIDITFEIGGIV